MLVGWPFTTAPPTASLTASGALSTPDPRWTTKTGGLKLNEWKFIKPDIGYVTASIVFTVTVTVSVIALTVTVLVASEITVKVSVSTSVTVTVTVIELYKTVSVMVANCNFCEGLIAHHLIL